ncbi:MAG: aminoacyl-tRNA hydrolase [bacterium]|nr:aminoacyl-tRNA hydrolase [bacterium]
MRLIIGLGNPGEEYNGTRHNVGFFVLDKIAKDEECDFNFDKSFNAELAKCKVSGKPSILVKPYTFVNKSGDAVKKLKLKFKIKPENIIVIHDDLDIDFGNFKLSFARSSGGHRGIESIIKALKTNKFWRLRIGLANTKLKSARRSKAKKGGVNGVGEFVLSKFTPAEQDKLKLLIKKALARLENIN